MMTALRSSLATAIAFFSFASVQAADFRILYAEPLRLGQVEASSVAQKQSPVRRTSLQAFGRRFDILLENNDALLARFARQQLDQIAGLQVLRGSIEGAPGSWVRLSVRNDGYEGAFWDGSDLYAIDSHASVAPYLQLAVGAAESGSVIYRLSDTQSGLSAEFCGVGGGGSETSSSSLTAYREMVAELRTSAALLATRDIEVAMLADFEFSSQYGNASMQEMVTRMNVVDGIFDTQLNVNIIPTDFTVFTNSDDPFVSSDAFLLLDEVSAYRSATPIVRNRALAHLLTGRGLDGNTIGVAYVDALCDVETGVSLSEDLGSVLRSALIIAHELGHNFGARHDGEGGSVCSSTPRTFLMAPTLNDSSTFSQCSVDTMQVSAAAATCIVPASTRDVAVTVPSPQLGVVIDEPFDYIVDVAAVGEGASHNISVSVAFGSFTQVLSASMPGASCRIGGQSAHCQLSELGPGMTSRLTVTAVVDVIGTFNSTVTVSASNDRLATNNSAEVSLNVSATQDASIIFTPMRPTAVVREPFDVVGTITATGSQTLVDAVAELQFVNLEVLSIEVDAGVCTQAQLIWTCPLGTLMPSQSAQIRLRMVADSVEFIKRGLLSLFVDGASTELRNGGFDVEVRPAFDIQIDPLSFTQVAAIEQVVEIPIVVNSVGTQTVPDVRLAITKSDARVSVAFESENVSCPNAASLDCNLGTMAPGARVEGVLRLRADEVLRASVGVALSPTTADDDTSNNQYSIYFDVRPGSDIGVPRVSSSPYIAYDRRSATIPFRFLSNGANAPTEVSAMVAFPDTFEVTSATLDGSACTVTGSVIQCSLAAMTQQSATILANVVPLEPGTYTARLTLSASNDAVVDNNTDDIELEVRPFVDAMLIPPTNRNVIVGTIFDLQFSVANGRYAMAQSMVTIDLGPTIVIATLTPSAGTCSQAGSRVECLLGTLPANSTATVLVRGYWTDAFGGMTAAFSSPYDVDGSNNRPDFTFTVDHPGDASVQVLQNEATVRANERVILPVDITAITFVGEAFVEFDFDATYLYQAEVSGAQTCDYATRPIRCALDGIEGGLEAGTVTRVHLGVSGRAPGTVPVAVRVGGRNDTNASNDTQTIEVTIQPAASVPTPTPPPAPPAPAGGGGGGGGSMNWMFIAAVFGLRAIRRREESLLRIRGYSHAHGRTPFRRLNRMCDERARQYVNNPC